MEVVGGASSPVVVVGAGLLCCGGAFSHGSAQLVGALFPFGFSGWAGRWPLFLDRWTATLRRATIPC